MAWINGEASAAETARALLEEAEASRQELANSVWLKLQTAPVRILEAPNSFIFDAVRWKSRHPISYADAFAVAAAVREQAPMVTGDPGLAVFRRRGGDVQIDWLA